MKGFDKSNFNILIVDDNIKNLQFLGKTLKQEKYNVEFAMNGKSALEWVETTSFDLILLDIMMPEMDGYEVCEKIRSVSKNNDIPILFLTAKADKESILKAFQIGAQDYITKPFDTKELLARVKTQLELKYGKEKLAMINEWLEEKVNERTNELNIANEKLNKANMELLVLDEAKTDFLNLISHEIRTPLNGITGFLHLIKKKTESESLKKYISLLDISVSRLESFAITALKITRLKTRGNELDWQKNNLSAIIEESLNELSELIKQKNTRIDFEGLTDDIIINGEYDLLKTVFINTLENAINFSDNNNSICINVYKDHLGTNCEIIDNGAGFSESILQNLFKFFTIGEESTNKNIGLNLALAKLILDVHSAKIKVENRPEGGAVVKLSFTNS